MMNQSSINFYQDVKPLELFYQQCTDKIKIGHTETLYPIIKRNVIENSQHCKELFSMSSTEPIHLLADQEVNPKTFQYVWAYLNGFQLPVIVNCMTPDEIKECMFYREYFQVPIKNVNTLSKPGIGINNYIKLAILGAMTLGLFIIGLKSSKWKIIDS